MTTEACQSSDVVEERACPWCAEMIKPAAIVCRFCVRDVVPYQSPGQAARSSSSTKGRKVGSSQTHRNATVHGPDFRQTVRPCSQAPVERKAGAYNLSVPSGKSSRKWLVAVAVAVAVGGGAIALAQQRSATAADKWIASTYGGDSGGCPACC